MGEWVVCDVGCLLQWVGIKHWDYVGGLCDLGMRCA